MLSSKILFVNHTAALGGAELTLANILSAYRDRAKVLLFEDGFLKQKLESAGVEVALLQANSAILNIRAASTFKSLTRIPQLWALAKKVAREASEFELIVANSQKAFVISALATLYGTPPLIWHLHDILTAKHFSGINRRLVIFLANRFASQVIVNSQATGDAFVAAGGNPKLIEVVYNGFDSEPFERVSVQQSSEIRARLGIGDVFLVGLFSRLSYWKGQHLLLDAIRELPHVHALIVGDVLFEEHEYASLLKTKASVPELQGRIHWLGFRRDIPTLMKTCDIVLHTSTEPEPFGNVIVEGQLAQKPVIASAAGGALEIIEDRVTGCLFPLGDAEVLKWLIAELASDRKLRATLARQGYASAKANFAFETMLHNYERVISSV